MFVIKRDGRRESVHFDKITSRLAKLAYGLSDMVEPITVSQKVCMGVYKGVTTVELDELAAETAAHMITTHPDFGILAARIAISNLHKNTKKVFSEVARDLYEYVEPKTGLPSPLLSKETYDVITRHAEKLDSAIIYARDYDYDYFGFKTLERSYLLKLHGKVVERPQQMLMRVAVGIHGDDVDKAIETYNMMSLKYFTHASPTLFNSGTPCPQLSSCFLATMKDDSIEGIYDTLKQCAMISKYAGGIGLSVHNIRASGSYIRGTNGTSNGLVPMLRVFNNTARYVDQGGGKRKGSIAIYLEPWHADIMSFLDMKKNHGAEEERARDLFYGLWVNDLFMRRVEDDGPWTLMCPHECPGLADTWGEEFEELYTRYERENRGRTTVKARKVWQAVLESQVETGTPYIMFKDACNRKSNQQNLGTIRSSNLCTEIVEYTSEDETAVCNLASLALPRFVDANGRFNHEQLRDVVTVVTRNLNRVIDVNFYPVEEARRSNMRHRPIGLGVQGLADTLLMMKLSFESDEARKLNRDIFETIYYAAVHTSVQLAKESGPYESYAGSPASKGILQYDMWGVTPSDRWDWAALKAELAEHGMRNSLLVAPMPTASTSQILGNNECFEPYTSNLYLRRTLAGEFVVVNPWLMRELIDMGLWTKKVRNQLIAQNGSVQNIREIPNDLKERYKTVWEIKQKVLVDMAADRGAFIDQSQSFNVHMTNANFGKLTSLHFYTWKQGLKTGLYYLRTKSAADAIKFTVDQKLLAETVSDTQSDAVSDTDSLMDFDLTVRAVDSPAPMKMMTSPIMKNFNISGTGATTTTTATTAAATEKTVEQWRKEREEQAKAMVCSLDNKEACLMCSG